jgi:hypothetical protein
MLNYNGFLKINEDYDTDYIKKYIRAHRSVEEFESDLYHTIGWTACEEGALDILIWAIDKGYKPEIKMMFYAAKGNYIDMVEYFLDTLHKDINAKVSGVVCKMGSGANLTLLDMAIGYGHTKLFNYLIEKGADITQINLSTLLERGTVTMMKNILSTPQILDLLVTEYLKHRDWLGNKDKVEMIKKLRKCPGYKGSQTEDKYDHLVTAHEFNILEKNVKL